MNKIYFLLILIVWPLLLLSQNETGNTKHTIGYNIGMVTGTGLSYKYTPTRLGIQTSIFYINSRNGHRYFNHSLSFNYSIIEKENYNWLIHAGGQLIHSWIQRPKGAQAINPEFYKYINPSAGIGIGINRNLGKRFELSTMLGAFYFENRLRNGTVLPTLEAGVFYKL